MSKFGGTFAKIRSVTRLVPTIGLTIECPQSSSRRRSQMAKCCGTFAKFRSVTRLVPTIGPTIECTQSSSMRRYFDECFRS